ncbi:MAG TPA: Glu-tRNA(Gln) amidotransferase subunit GatD [Thermoplasmata archaeon]|nr:Glu-tRNA(Gln) amidotransferase subunit GatD [Thermoplasmata archaeon]
MGFRAGDAVEVHTDDGRIWRGLLVPAHELSGAHIVQLKLESGYNVGVRIGPNTHILAAPGATRARTGLPPPPVPSASAEGTGPTPPVTLLSTGGTIASRVDYQTGGVRPVHDEREILEMFPELSAAGPVHIVPVFDKLSEEITPADWGTLAREVTRAFDGGAKGVVVAHGTDTLHYTASALSFLLENLPGPVVVVGAQRSPDRPSSDGFGNLTAAVRVAREPGLFEVVVVMHSGLSDHGWAIHRGTRVRKMHSSRRDAFRSRNGPPLGLLDDGQVRWNEPRAARPSAPLAMSRPLDPRGALLWVYPGLDPERASASIASLRGVVLAGTGLGHASSVHFPWIREALARGVVVAMTTQCLEGEVDPYVYATGRRLLELGVTYAEDLLPETGYVKLLWALGQSDDAKEVARLFLADRAGEFAHRRTIATDAP